MATTYVSPVSGTWAAKSGSKFKARRGFRGRLHAGNDLQAPNGSRAVAAVGGVVQYAGHNSGYQHNAVVMGDDGYAYRYATHGPLAVKVGQRVEQGQVVGTIARGHLHLEVIPPTSPAYARMVASPGAFVGTSFYGKGVPVTVDPASFFGVELGSKLAAGAPVGNTAKATLVAEMPADPFGVFGMKAALPPPVRPAGVDAWKMAQMGIAPQLGVRRPATLPSPAPPRPAGVDAWKMDQRRRLAEAVAKADLAPAQAGRNLAAQDAAVANRYRDNALRQTASIPGGRLSPEYVRPAAPVAPRRNLAMTAPQAGSSASIQPRTVTTTREGPGARIVPRQTYQPDLSARSRLPAVASQQMAETNAARAENVRRNAVQNLRGNLLAGSSPPKTPSPTYADKKATFLRDAQPTVTSDATRQAIRLATSGPIAPSKPTAAPKPAFTPTQVASAKPGTLQGYAATKPPIIGSPPNVAAAVAFAKAKAAAPVPAMGYKTAPVPAMGTVMPAPAPAPVPVPPKPVMIAPPPLPPAPPPVALRRVVAQPQGMMGSSGGTKTTTGSIKDRSHGVFDREGGARSRSTTRVTGARKNTMSGRSSSLSRAGSDR